MTQIIVPFNGQQVRIQYFFDTITLGQEVHAPICNIYTIICGPDVPAVVGAHFHMIRNVGDPQNGMIHYPINDPLNIAEHQWKGAIASAVMEHAHP